MIFEQIKLEMDCYAKIKELATSSPYDSFDALVADIITDVSNATTEIVTRYARNILPNFDVNYCYFTDDTSLLYAFNKSDLSMMIVKNPSLSVYVKEHDIYIKETDPNIDGIYLGWILNQHLEIFSRYPYRYYTKDNIVSSPVNPLIWAEIDKDYRWVLKTFDLADLYRDPSAAMSISNVVIAKEWRQYSFLYVNNGALSQDDEDLLTGKGAESEARP